MVKNIVYILLLYLPKKEGNNKFNMNIFYYTG